MYRSTLLVFIFISVLCTGLNAREPIVKAYYMYWSKASLPASDLPWDDISHVANAFIWPNANGSLVTAQALHPELIAQAKANDVKIIIAVGGWGQSDAFSGIAADPALRATFIANLKAYCLQHGYNGVDLDWEYPRSADRANVTLLIREMYEAFQEVGPPLGISIAMPSVDWQNGYDIPAILDYIDWFGVMTYDFHGSWTDRSGHNSPLYSPLTAVCNTGSIHQSMQYYLQRGVPREKLLAGLASYGRRFNSSAMCSGITTSVNNGAAVPYNAAVELMEQGWTYHWDDVSMVPWLMNADSTRVVSFDDTVSFRLKADYIREENLRGAMVWALGYDKTPEGHTLMNVLGAIRNTQTTVEPEPETAADFRLMQNYPNPFNPETIIRFELSEPGLVRLSVYDMLGRKVNTLVDDFRSAGLHTIRFDASSLNSGTYIYDLELVGKRKTRKMILLR
jgi:chitinase